MISQKSKSEAKKSLWQAARTGLLLVSSAALGGVALAFWNRRALARLRGEEEHGESPAGAAGWQIAGTEHHR
jgi:hypothetical protein